MKFEEAKKIGLECGLKTPLEWIENIIHNATSLFSHDKLNEELLELLDDYEKLRDNDEL